jgi:hypothetical protein
LDGNIPGLPAVLFKKQKSQFGYILKGFGMKNVSIFNDQLAIWYNVWPFGIVCSHLVYFSRFGPKNLASLICTDEEHSQPV